MTTSIEGRVTKIGNSQGIRIPKLLLEQSGIRERVNIEVRDNQIIITAASRSRVGWAEAFAQMASNQEDRLLDEATATVWDGKEWEW
jgi:antitoxin MazE